MALLNIIIGTALLFFGRKVFWLFVIGTGFIAGMSLAANTFNGPGWLNITVGILFGFIAALLAIFLKNVAIGLAGFLVGGYIGLQVLPILNIEGGWVPWLIFIVGGIFGVILVNAFLDWALILLSALAGSSLLVEAVDMTQSLSIISYIILAAVGISVQAKGLKREKR